MSNRISSSSGSLSLNSWPYFNYKIGNLYSYLKKMKQRIWVKFQSNPLLSFSKQEWFPILLSKIGLWERSKESNKSRVNYAFIKLSYSSLITADRNTIHLAGTKITSFLLILARPTLETRNSGPWELTLRSMVSSQSPVLVSSGGRLQGWRKGCYRPPIL